MNFTPFNEAEFTCLENGYLLKAKPASDLVVDPLSGTVTSNAVYLAGEVTGDFTFSAKVSHEFLSTYDACCLLAYSNDTLWSKACFECTEEGESAVVTVMTNGRSDDANSVRIAGKTVWLQMCRSGQTISVQYSEDGGNWVFVRILYTALPSTVRLGILAQSPVGEGGSFRFEDIRFINKAPANMRFGR